MQQGTRDSESAPAVTVAASFVWLGRLAVFSMRNTAKTLWCFIEGAAGWSRLVGARKGVRFDARGEGGGAVTSEGGYFWHGFILSLGGRERNKRVGGKRDKRRESRRDKTREKQVKNKRKTSVVGQARTVGKKLPDGSDVIRRYQIVCREAIAELTA